MNISMRIVLKFLFLILIYLLFINQINAESRIRIAGSKTLYYFLTFAIEDYVKLRHKTSPVIEATGSGSGINLFCKKEINIAASSRKILDEERVICKNNGIEEIEELVLGYDAIVFATSKNSTLNFLPFYSIYKAIAAKLPLHSELVENFYTRWKQINKDLSEQEILIYGPSLNSGTKQLLMEKLSNQYCISNPVFKIKFPKDEERSRACMNTRKDSRYIEIGENQNFLLQKILQDQNAIAILSYSHLANLHQDIKILPIDNIMPNKQTIATEIYPLTRGLYLYYNYKELQLKDDLHNFIFHLRNSGLLNPGGLLETKGLIYK